MPSTMTEDALLQFLPQSESSSGAAAPSLAEPISAISEAIYVGMPHLALCGLSENWLLKECGHRHWTLLATKLGLSRPDFRDAKGNRLYAAFTAIRISDAQLGSVGEGDELRLRASLGRISRTQWLSTHVAVCGDQVIAKVVMISVFLRRTVTGSNRHVERGTAVAAALPPIDETMSGADLANIAHRLRAGRWQKHLGFGRGTKTEPATFIFCPCPHNDFNGADFLYFATFQSVADRAEAHWGLQGQTISATRHRELFYYGNIDVGDGLLVVLRGKRDGVGPARGRLFWHWSQIFRVSDEKLIADVFTARHPTTRLKAEPFKPVVDERLL
jgi:probable biosynthetic protein (TIGR04099 family)